MYEILIQSQFSGAHHLKRSKGKSEGLHGHNYRVEVKVSSEVVDRDGIVLDFKILSKRLERVLQKFHHKYLNKLPEFKGINPTSENIARVIFEYLQKSIKEKNVKLNFVTVWESDTCCGTYREE